MRRKLLKLLVLVSLLLPLAPLTVNAQQDCDDNAVIRCGVNASTLKPKYQENQGGNVQAVFAEFGIANEAALDGLVSGWATSSNEVFVGDKLVATEAVTAGRQNIPGSTPILGGAFYRRPPSVSFKQERLSALVKMDGETFRYAIIESCGNPVNAKDVPNPPVPQPAPLKPDFTVVKDVRLKGQTNWLQSVMTKPGDQVEFRIVVKNTGQAALTDVNLRDNLPTGLGKPQVISGSASDSLFSTVGLNIGNIQVGEQREFIFASMVSTSADACTSGLHNIAHARPAGLTEKTDDAVVQVCKPAVQPTPPPPPPAPQPPAPPAAPATKELPNTGPSALVGLFTATSLLGIAVYRLKEFYLARL